MFPYSGVQAGLELGVYVDATVASSDGPETALSEGLAAVEPCSLAVNHLVPDIDVLWLVDRHGWVPGIRNANFSALCLTPMRVQVLVRILGQKRSRPSLYK